MQNQESKNQSGAQKNSSQLTGIERQLVLQYLMDANVPVTLTEEIELGQEKAAENEKSEELQNQEKTGENSSDAEKQTVQEIILFDEYILGEPFEMNSLCEVPVRFVQKKGFVDVVLYFFKNPNENWKINQLQILKVQKKFKKDVR